MTTYASIFSLLRKTSVRLACLSWFIAPSSGCRSAEDETQILYLQVGHEETGLPDIPPSISPDQVDALLSGFNWITTTELPEVDDEGRPAFYYTLIGCATRGHVELLDVAGLLYGYVPLFGADTAYLDEYQFGMVEPSHNTAGTIGLVYALLPGVAYNAARRAALEGEPTFPFIQVTTTREVGALSTAGMISFDYVVNNGGMFESQPGNVESDGAVNGQPLFARVARIFVRAARGAINGLRIFAGGFRLNRKFRMRMRVVERDSTFYEPTFRRGTPDFERNIIRRVWGSNRGRAIVPDGTWVYYWANIGLRRDMMNARGEVELNAQRDRKFRVTMRMRNSAASLLGLGSVFEQEAMLYSGDGGVDRDDDITLALDVSDDRIYELSLLTDTWQYMVSTHGYAPSEAIVARRVTSNTAYAPCYSFYGFFTTSLANQHRYFSLFPAIQAALGTEADILLPNSDRTDRVIVPHEYGHYLMCNMIYDESRRDFGRAWGAVSLEAVTDGGMVDESKRARIAAEGWADFISSSVVGGTNYFDLEGASLTSDKESSVCTSAGPGIGGPSSNRPCCEDNTRIDSAVTGPFPEQQTIFTGAATRQIASVATSFADFLDASGPGCVPSHVQWTGSSIGGAIQDPGLSCGLDDESVTFDSTGLRDTIGWWSYTNNILTPERLMEAAGRALTRHYDESEICPALKLHDGRIDCVVGRVIPLAPGPAGPLHLAARAHVASRSDSQCEVAAQWMVADTTVASSTVETFASGGRVSSEVVPTTVGSIMNATRIRLPYNIAVNVRVTTRAADGRTAAPSQVNLVTPPQPVGAVVPEVGNIGATWAPVAASRYRVYVSNRTTGYQEVFDIVGSTFAGPDGCATGSHNDQIEIRVTSVNSVGEESSIPSLSTYTNLVCLG